MSNKTPSTSLQSTKQMLDELDALMEKMLTLPVNELEEAMIPPAPAKEPTLSATVTLLDPPPTETVPASSVAKKPTMPSYQTPEVAQETTMQVAPPLNPPHFEAPAPSKSVVDMTQLLSQFGAPPVSESPQYEAPPPLTNDVLPVSVLPRMEPLLKEEVPEPSLGTQWVHMPLLWVNHGFDRTTGGLLGGQAGRFLLGLSGLVLMSGAVVWFLKDWLGWTW